MSHVLKRQRVSLCTKAAPISCAVLILLAAVITSLIPSIAGAVEKIWNVPNGNWSDTDPFPWNTSPEPSNYDAVHIRDGKSANITQVGEVCAELNLETGSIQMTGGTLTASGQTIGQRGTAIFTQSGGINSAYFGLNVGGFSSNGYYHLCSTGQLSTTFELIGGYESSGTFTHTSGTNSISESLFIGGNYNSSGMYDLSGTGQLSAKYEYISLSEPGTIRQTGGTNMAAYVEIGPNGTYNLISGTLNINGGFENHGTWNLTNNSATLNITSSIVNLTDGNIVGRGQASLNIDANSLAIVPANFQPFENFASYRIDGIVHEIGSTIDILPAQNIRGIGDIEDNVKCRGSLAATSGHYINLLKGLELSGMGIVDLGTGRLYVNNLTSGMSGGSLNANALYVGANTNIEGKFIHSGGTSTITYDLFLGNSLDTSGEYVLSGSGQLNAFNVIVGMYGNGTFTQTGGIHSNSGAVQLGYDLAASGTYNLIGGTLIVELLSKGPGTAIFNFGGGTLQTKRFNFNTDLLMTLTGDGGDANIDVVGDTAVFNGVLYGPGGLKKTGSGTLILNALNTYSGNTTVDGGTMEITGGIATEGTSLIDVRSGKAILKTVNVDKPNLDIATSASAVFEVVNGTHHVGAITDGGITQVDGGAVLSVAFITQNKLTIKSGAKIIVRPIVGEQLGTQLKSVPEPSAYILLAVGCALLPFILLCMKIFQGLRGEGKDSCENSPGASSPG
jgi:autotransporter-associated beta strand protein